MSNRKYVILNADEVSTVNFEEVLETSADTLRYNVAGDQTFVKYEGVKPAFLEGKDTLSKSEISALLEDESWTTPEEEL
jgi:hypothetical protein